MLFRTVAPISFSCFRIVLELLVEFLAGRNFRSKNIRGICFSDFGRKLRNQTLEIDAIAKICFAKFNFSSNIFVCLAVTVEKLYNKD